MVGYDHRRGAARALAVARLIAGRIDAAITLVHVLEPPPARVAMDRLTECEAEAGWINEALTNLGDVRDRHWPESGRWQIEAHMGHPWEVLVSAAKSGTGNLIIVGPHEHTRWGHSFMGCTAQRVVRLATCPVLAVK